MEKGLEKKKADGRDRSGVLLDRGAGARAALGVEGNDGAHL